MAKKRGRKPANPYFNNKDRKLKVELEKEYYEIVKITNPDTGEVTEQKVKIQRFKSPYQMGRAVLGRSDSVLSRAEKYHDSLGDADENMSED